MKDYLIWWINSGDECDLILEIADRVGILPYLQEQIESMKGRPTRGRLWVPKEIDVTAISGELLNHAYFDHRGGIVFHAGDLDIVRSFPGFVTTLTMEPL